MLGSHLETLLLGLESVSVDPLAVWEVSLCEGGLACPGGTHHHPHDSLSGHLFFHLLHLLDHTLVSSLEHFGVEVESRQSALLSIEEHFWSLEFMACIQGELVVEVTEVFIAASRLGPSSSIPYIDALFHLILGETVVLEE